MATSGNVTKYVVLHSMNIYWHFMVVPVKFSFWFNSYINSQTSVKLADKMQNLLRKQETEGAYNTDLYELQKNCHLNHVFQINSFYEISVYTKLNVCEDQQFVIQAFSSH